MSNRNKWMVFGFAFLMLAHWLEHAFQAWQIYVMHMPRACALGMLGMKYPWLIKTESLHFGFAIFTTVGLLMLWRVFVNGYVASDHCVIDPPSANYWKAATYISIWHLFEHSLLFTQAMIHHNFWGSPVPTSVIQQIIPRVELHLFYNSIVTIPIAIAMYLLIKLLRTPPAHITNVTFTMPSEPGEHGSVSIEHIK
jgi:hypothetical protein